MPTFAPAPTRAHTVAAVPCAAVVRGGAGEHDGDEHERGSDPHRGPSWRRRGDGQGHLLGQRGCHRVLAGVDREVGADVGHAVQVAGVHGRGRVVEEATALRVHPAALDPHLGRPPARSPPPTGAATPSAAKTGTARRSRSASASVGHGRRRRRLGPSEEAQRVPRQVEGAAVVVLHVTEGPDASTAHGVSRATVGPREHRQPVAVLLRGVGPVADRLVDHRPALPQRVDHRVEGPVPLLAGARTIQLVDAAVAARRRSTRVPSAHARSPAPLASAATNASRDGDRVDRALGHAEPGVTIAGSAIAAELGRGRGAATGSPTRRRGSGAASGDEATSAATSSK